METRKARIVLGVTGSTAASKAQSIALALQRCGFEVRVAMTASAKKFVTPMLLASVVKDPVYGDLWSDEQGGERHIEWAAWADAMVIAPATASVIASLWQGTFDSPVTLVAGNIKPEKVFIAPAVSKEMWEHPAVARNVEALKGFGYQFIGPLLGPVASGAIGMRLIEPRDVAIAISEKLSATSLSVNS